MSSPEKRRSFNQSQRSRAVRKAVPVVLMFVVVIALVLLATWAAGSGR